MNPAPRGYVVTAMRKARAPRVNTHGWGVRVLFLGRTIAERSAPETAATLLGEAPDCDFVVPGLGERVALTRGAALTIPPGLAGRVRVGEAWEEVAADRTAPVQRVVGVGDVAELHVVAHPAVALQIRRVELERLPWSARLPVRDLARELVMGAGLVAVLALLWRVERVENVLKLRGDPSALEDSALFRAMFFAPAVEPVEVARVRERFVAPVLPALPVPPPPPAGPEIADAGPAVPTVVAVDTDVAPMPVGEKLLAAREAPRAGKTKRARRERGGDAAIFAVIGAKDPVVDMISAVDVVEGGVLGVPGGGVEGGVVGGVVGGVIGRIDEAAVVDVLTDRPTVVGPDAHAAEESPPPQPGEHSHGESGALAVRGELDGTAAAVVQASCPDPTISRKKQIDIVFAVDVSTTMNFMLGKIEREIAAVDATVRAEGLDARYGLVVFVDDVKVANGGRPYADLAALQAELKTWQAFTASNRQIASPEANLDWPENTLDALHAAADQFAWRPAATTLRTVVHATDDDFGEAPAVQSGQVVQHSYRQTLAALQAAEVRVFSFAAKVGGQCECLDVKAGLFTRYFGQQAIPAATGGAVFDIDEVASGALSFGKALSGALQTAVCTHYPLWPAAAGR